MNNKIEAIKEGFRYLGYRVETRRLADIDEILLIVTDLREKEYTKRDLIPGDVMHSDSVFKEWFNCYLESFKG